MANLGSDDTPIAGKSFGLPSGWALTENGDGEIVIEDSGGNVVFRRDETAGEWVTDSIDVGSVDVKTLNSADVKDATSGAVPIAEGDGTLSMGTTGDEIPPGTIVMWSGSVADIPIGWTLCDGTDGTPDLQDRFVVGAGGQYSVDDIGGEAEVTLTEDELPSHNHETGVVGNDDGPWYTSTFSMDETRAFDDTSVVGGDGGFTTNTGSNESHENIPPYYALAYMMKL